MLRIVQKIGQPGPGLGLRLRERGSRPAVALDAGARQAQSSVPAAGPRMAGAQSPRPRGWHPAHAQAGHLVVCLRVEHEHPRVGSPVENVVEILQPFDRMPPQVDQARRGRPARSRDCPGRPATASRTSGPAGRVAGGAVAGSSGPAAHARSPRRESKAGFSSPRSSRLDSTPHA